MHSIAPTYLPHYTVKGYCAWEGNWELCGHTLCHGPCPDHPAPTPIQLKRWVVDCNVDHIFPRVRK